MQLLNTPTMAHVVMKYVLRPERHVLTVHTFDGVDRTFQSCGLNDKPFDHYDEARLVMTELGHRVGVNGVPREWLLDVSIIVESYDRVTRHHRTTRWVIVWAPNTVVVPCATREATNPAYGFFHVLTTDSTSRIPAHLAYDDISEIN